MPVDDVYYSTISHLLICDDSGQGSDAHVKRLKLREGHLAL